MKKKTDIDKLKTPEEKIQYLYREVFHMSQRLEDIYSQQNELGKLMLNLLQIHDPAIKLDSLFKP